MALGNRREFEAREYLPALRIPLFAARVPLGELLARHPFLSWNDGALHVAPGAWRVTQPLVVPPWVELEGSMGKARAVSSPPLIVSPGAGLHFAEDAYLLTHGPLHLMGTADAPVSLSGVASRPWLGIAVLESSEPSRWTHFEVLNAGRTRHGPWELTGGVTFYRSRVSMRDGAFRGSGAEDSLSLVHAHFALERVEFSDADSDALGGDFSSGEVTNCTFSRVGGSGVDLMASELRLADSSFDDVGDAAISVGGASRLTASVLRIRDADIAVASKDASAVDLSKLQISEIRRAGFATYVKKLEYTERGPPSLVATGVDFDDSAPLAWVQAGSSLIVEGRKMPANDLHAEALYRPGQSQRTSHY
jgi:hypothetical protein